MTKTTPMKVAKAGDELTGRATMKLRSSAEFWRRVLSTKEGITVAPKSDTQGGQWVCVDCGEAFQNNMTAHSHVKSPRRAWWTGDRFEAP